MGSGELQPMSATVVTHHTVVLGDVGGVFLEASVNSGDNEKEPTAITGGEQFLNVATVFLDEGKRLTVGTTVKANH